MRNFLASALVCLGITVGTCTVEREGDGAYRETTVIEIDDQVVGLANFIDLSYFLGGD